MKPLRIGTRGSKLALWQANWVRESLLGDHSGLEVELVVIRTAGDEASDGSGSEPTGVGFFTTRIERALLDGRVDLAVHSLKDLPTAERQGLAVVAVPERGDPADALVTNGVPNLESLPEGGTVLTGSPRRRAQILHRRPDLAVRPVRGNVDTRLRKLSGSGADALVLACAGLKRLALEDRIAQRLEPMDFVPACGQGALAVQARADDERMATSCRALEHLPTRLAVGAERAFLAELRGGCRVPVGAYGGYDVETQQLHLCGLVASEDGARLVRRDLANSVASPAEAENLGRCLAERVLAAGGREILEGVRQS